MSILNFNAEEVKEQSGAKLGQAQAIVGFNLLLTKGQPPLKNSNKNDIKQRGWSGLDRVWKGRGSILFS